MLGIPTSSEAAQIAPDYKKVLSIDRMNETLRWFNGVFCTVFAHNHVAEAYRDSGNTDSIPYDIVKMKTRKLSCSERKSLKMYFHANVNVRVVPEGVDQLLQPNLVYESFISRLDKFLSVLEATRSYFDKVKCISYSSSTMKPLEGLYGFVQSEDCITDHVFTESSSYFAKGCGVEWRITYNPYQLAKHMADDFRSGISHARDNGLTKIDKIATMMSVARIIEESDNYKLFDFAFPISQEQIPFMIENRQGHPVNIMHQENEQIAQKSDLWLRFDEGYFIHNIHSKDSDSNTGQSMIPACCIIDEKQRFHAYSLSHREMLRLFIKQQFKKKGCVIINGVEYRVSNGSICANRPTYPEIVNLFGSDVMEPDGTLARPEEWARNEVRLVKGFQQNDESSIKQLVEAYDCDNSYGNPSFEKKLEYLQYRLHRAMKHN